MWYGDADLTEEAKRFGCKDIAQQFVNKSHMFTVSSCKRFTFCFSEIHPSSLVFSLILLKNAQRFLVKLDLVLVQGLSTFFLPFTLCQLPNIKFTPCFFVY